MKPQYIGIDENGDKFYYSDKELKIRHREDGPACEYADGTKIWYINGQRHREDGPAVEDANGHKYWYLNGKLLSEAEFNARNKSSCEGKVVEIDGKKYRLTSVS